MAQRIADSAAVPEAGRLHLKIENRYLTLLRLNGKVFCIDSVCFHAGGPLGIGDIEDVNGRACIVCPWHYYKIDVETGDKYYQQVKFVNGKMVEGDWASNGIKQRTHKCEEREDGGIWVTVAKDPPRIDSDEYACMASCGDRVINSTGRPAKVHSVGGDGKKPSGAVIRAAREAAQAANPLPSPLAEGASSCSGSGSAAPAPQQ